MTNFDYTFQHRGGTVVMFNHPNQEEAKEAFQERYGYYPLNAIKIATTRG